MSAYYKISNLFRKHLNQYFRMPSTVIVTDTFKFIVNKLISEISQIQSGNLPCLFVLRFYGPVNPMGSYRARSVYLTTRLLSRLSPLIGWPVLCHSFARNWQLTFLYQRKGENDRRNRESAYILTSTPFNNIWITNNYVLIGLALKFRQVWHCILAENM